jgi:hypothetical protein
MRKISGFAIAAALVVAGIAGWATSSTHARVDAAATGPRIDPIELTTSVGLSVEHFHAPLEF